MNRDEVVKYVSDGFEVAKGGDALNVYAAVKDIFDSGNLPAKSHYPFGWIIYYALHQSPDYEIENRKQMLATYLKLTVTKPHKLHSMILTEAVRLYKDSQNAAFGKKREETVHFSVVKFLSLWNLDNLRPGDWRRKDLEGKALSSTVEKMITVAVDELEYTRSIPDKILVDVIDQALAAFPDSFNLYSQRATLHELMGETEQGKELLQKALLLAPGKFFLWSKLASFIDPEADMRLYVSLLYKALKSPGPEQFKGRIRLDLAKTWVSREMYSNALWELNRVKSIYEANGWHTPAMYQALMSKIPAGTAATDPEPMYQRVANLADDMLYSSIPAVEMKKTYHKNPEANSSARFGKPLVAWRLTDAQGNNIWFNPEKFGVDPHLPNGISINATIFNGKVVKASLAE